MADLVELSKESLRRYRYSLGPVDSERYKSTLYVAITENNKVVCSNVPDILKVAYQCILIHCKSKLAISNWYDWYKIEFINHDGLNLEGIIGNDCYIDIIGGAGYNASLTLHHRDEELYTCRPPYEGHMQGLWDAYCSTLNPNEIDKLKEELSRKEKCINDLEEQIDHYKQMLIGIKEIIQLGEE